LLADGTTRNVKLTFVEGRNLCIDTVLYIRRQTNKAKPSIPPIYTEWKIHGKWLSLDAVFRDDRIDSTQLPNQADMDHTVLYLWESLLDQIHDHELKTRLRSMVTRKIKQIPRSVVVTPIEQFGQLKVTWESMESYCDVDEELIIFLHSDTCSRRGDSTDDPGQDKVYRKGIGTELCYFSYGECVVNIMSEPKCNCSSQASPIRSKSVTFTDLDPERLYIALIARNEDGAFFNPQISDAVHPSDRQRQDHVSSMSHNLAYGMVLTNTGPRSTGVSASALSSGSSISMEPSTFPVPAAINLVPTAGSGVETDPKPFNSIGNQVTSTDLLTAAEQEFTHESRVFRRLPANYEIYIAEPVSAEPKKSRKRASGNPESRANSKKGRYES
jgi:hypothetical protein